jgi:hypothetical protein
MTRAARGVRRSAAREVERNAQRKEGLLEGRVEGFAQTQRGIGSGRKEEQTKLKSRERVAFTRRRGVFMGM